MSKTHARTYPVLPHKLPKPHKSSGGVHFADFVPHGLPRLWTHSSVNVRHFVHDYSLAVIMTAVFIVLVVGASWLRLSQRASLANLLASASSITQDISSLVSLDKTDAPTRGSVTDDAAPAPSGTSTSFAINSSGTAQPTTPAPTGGGSTGGGGSSGGGTPTPPPVFSAAIASFQRVSTTQECSNPNNPKLQNCSIRYTFSAGVNTQNGPGSVSYGWRSNVTGANQDGSYSASSGSSQQTLQKSVLISCLNLGSYSMQFVLLSPTQVQSNTLTINHNCLGI